MYKSIFIGVLIILASLLTIDYIPYVFLIGIFLAGLYVGNSVKENGWIMAGLTGVIAVVLVSAFLLIFNQVGPDNISYGRLGKDVNTDLIVIMTVIGSFIVGGLSLIGGVLGNKLSRTK